MAKYGELNSRPFSHSARYGTMMEASRCDLAEGYQLFRPKRITDEQFASDVGEIFHWHAMNICPDLNGYTLGGCKKIHSVE